MEDEAYEVEEGYEQEFISENEIMLKEKLLNPKYNSEVLDLVLSNLSRREVMQLHLLSVLIELTSDIDELEDARDFFIREKALIVNSARAYDGKTLELAFSGAKKFRREKPLFKEK